LKPTPELLYPLMSGSATTRTDENPDLSAGISCVQAAIVVLSRGAGSRGRAGILAIGPVVVGRRKLLPVSADEVCGRDTGEIVDRAFRVT